MLGEQRASDLHEQWEKQKDQTVRLQQSVQDLEDMIRQARQKRTLLLARMARAESGRKINAAMDRVNSRSAFAEFRRLEERVDRGEALEEAWDRMAGRDPDADELERQFEEDDRKERLKSEFEELKRRVGAKP